MGLDPVFKMGFGPFLDPFWTHLFAPFKKGQDPFPRSTGLCVMLEESQRQIARLTKSNTSLAATVKESRETIIEPRHSDRIKEHRVLIDVDQSVDTTDTSISIKRHNRNPIVLFRNSAEWPVFKVLSFVFTLIQVLCHSNNDYS